MKRLLLGFAAFGLLVRLTGPAQAQYDFTTFDVPGASSTQANGINDAGQIVGWYTGAGGNRGFLLDIDGSYTTFDVPDATQTSANGITNSGQNVGVDLDAGSADHGFLLDIDGSYTTLDVPGATRGTYAEGINNAGQIVGVYQSDTYHSFLLSDGQYTLLDDVGDWTSAFGINNAGQIAGTAWIKIGGIYAHGFLRDTDGSYITFRVALETHASGINDADNIVGSAQSAVATFGFLRSSDGSYTRLDVPGATATYAAGINNASQIVGFYRDAAGTHHGFLATPGG